MHKLWRPAYRAIVPIIMSIPINHGILIIFWREIAHSGQADTRLIRKWYVRSVSGAKAYRVIMKRLNIGAS